MKSKGRGLEEGASRALMRQVREEGCGGRVEGLSWIPRGTFLDPRVSGGPFWIPVHIGV